MELVAELTSNQFILYIPVALVLVSAIIVFSFGFKKPEQPPFNKLTSGVNDDRKLAGKKRKIKEKKTTSNGSATNIPESKSEKSPTKEKEQKKSPSKEVVDAPKQKKNEAEKNKKNEALKIKKVETIEDIKNKKNKKVGGSEKPVDFDDGNWETVPTKADKKKKADSPAKKDKKDLKKKTEKAVEIDKLVKEVVNKELREKELDDKKKQIEIIEDEIKIEEKLKTEEKIEAIIESKIEPTVEEIVAVIVEEKKEKEKKKEKKPKKEKEVVEKKEEVVEKKEIVEKKLVEKKIVEKKVVEKKVVEKKQPAVEPVVAQIAEAMSESIVPKKEAAAAFDELGDVWTEAKVAKKSKKKARRE